MRLSFVLLAAAATLMASSQVVFAVTTSEVAKSIDAAHTDSFKSRLLRASKTEIDELDDSSNDEERVMPGGVSEKITSASAKLTKSLSTVDTYNIKANELIESNKVLFKTIEGIIGNPYRLYQKVGIPEKLKTMTMAQLQAEPDYILWLEYSKWWKGTYGKD